MNSDKLKRPQSAKPIIEAAGFMSDESVEDGLEALMKKATPTTREIPLQMNIKEWNGSPDRFEHLFASSIYVRNSSHVWSKPRELLVKYFGAAIIECGWSALCRPALLKGPWGILRKLLTVIMQLAWRPQQALRIDPPGLAPQPSDYRWSDSLTMTEAPDVERKLDPPSDNDDDDDGGGDDEGADPNEKPAKGSTAHTAARIGACLVNFRHGDERVKRQILSVVCSVSCQFAYIYITFN
jgi:hypothetical protein